MVREGHLAGWVAGRSILVGQIVEGRGEPLGEAAAVDEDDGRPVRADELGHAQR